MSIQQIFDQSKGALATNQKSLAVTSHNIANANTEGYSRQRVETENIAPSAPGTQRVGGGVNIKAITRSHSSFVARRLEELKSKVSSSQSYSDIIHQVEDVFTDDAEQGLNKSFSSFFNDVRNLSTQPTSAPMRSTVIESAKGIVSKFQTLRESLNAIQQDVDNRIASSVEKVNSLSQKIADLNVRIQAVEANHGFANDERDMRDLALKELSSCIDIQVSESDHGALSVSAGRVGTLVAGGDSFRLEHFRGGENGYFEGAMQVGIQSSTGASRRTVTQFVNGGELGGFLQVRDKTLGEMAEKLDTLAFQFADGINKQHQSGFTVDGRQGAKFFDFSGPGGIKNAAGTIKMNDELAKDTSAIATGLVRNAAGDNRSLLALANLENAKIVNGKSSFTDYTGEMIARVGIETQTSDDALENNKGIMQQLENLREQQSGVSIDEEAMNMVKYQKAFDASAKMIQAADSMLETVLNIKRF
jgi:flagellar hook-associated protein 1 FlgK